MPIFFLYFIITPFAKKMSVCAKKNFFWFVFKKKLNIIVRYFFSWHYHVNFWCECYVLLFRLILYISNHAAAGKKKLSIKNIQTGCCVFCRCFRHFSRVFTLCKPVVQTNFPTLGMTYIFGSGMKSTFTWAMPYKWISAGLIT